MAIIQNPYLGSSDDRVLASNPLPLLFKITNDRFPNNTTDTTFSISSYTYNSQGYLVVTLSASADYQINDYVTITNEPSINGTHRVVTVTSSTEYVLNFQGSGIGGVGGNIQRLYSNYKQIIDVYVGLNADHIWASEQPSELVVTLAATPDSNNVSVFDISSAVRSKLTPFQNNYNPSYSPFEIGMFTAFYIDVRESYSLFDSNGLSYLVESEVLYSSLECYATNSMFQPRQNSLINNLAEYVVKYPSFSSLPKFLTDFETPTHWKDYQFDLYIYLDRTFAAQYDAQNLSVEIVQYDSSGVQIDTDTATLFVIDGLPNGMTYGLIRIRPEELVNISDLCSYYTVQLLVGATELSEVKTVNYVSEIPCFVKYFRWLNTLGTWDGWLFVGYGEENIEIDSDENVFGRNIDILIDNWNYIEYERAKHTVLSENINLVRSQFLKASENRAIGRILESPQVYLIEPKSVVTRVIDDGTVRVIDTGEERVVYLGEQLFFQKQILISKNSFLSYKDNQKLYTIEFEYRDTFIKRNQIQ